MSWYFLGGFSAYFSVPSGRRLNHSGCSVSHGWSAEALIARSRQSSIPCSPSVVTSASKSSQVPSSACSASWPPLSSPIAYGLPGSPGSATSVLLRPLRFVCPIGWTGGKYRTSKPSSASRGTCSAVPRRPPQERGNSSYQAPKRPRSRSTSSGSGGSSCSCSDRSPAPAASTSAATSASRTARTSPSCSSASATAVSRRLAAPVARSAASRRSTTPSDASPARSAWPASILRLTSSRHEAKGSVHARMVYCQRPGGPSTSKRPAHRTPWWWASTGVSGAVDHRRAPGAFQHTSARSTSWPSRKTSTETSTTSPTVRLTGQRPPSTTGAGYWMRMRAGACVGSRAGIG